MWVISGAALLSLSSSLGGFTAVTLLFGGADVAGNSSVRAMTIPSLGF